MHDGLTDFDFLFGTWKIHNRRLRERLKGSRDWDEFESTNVARHLWGARPTSTSTRASAPPAPSRA